jgi:hypothetical protein
MEEKRRNCFVAITRKKECLALSRGKNTRDGRTNDSLPTPSGSRANQNVWSAALSQAKNEGDSLVCANVFGLHWSTRLLAMMECAALSSYLVRQSVKTFPVSRFRERRVRPLCHLIVRQQTWQKSSTPAGFVLSSRLLDHSISFVDPHLQVNELQLQLRQQHAQCA